MALRPAPPWRLASALRSSLWVLVMAHPHGFLPAWRIERPWRIAAAEHGGLIGPEQLIQHCFRAC